MTPLMLPIADSAKLVGKSPRTLERWRLTGAITDHGPRWVDHREVEHHARVANARQAATRFGGQAA